MCDILSHLHHVHIRLTPIIVTPYVYVIDTNQRGNEMIFIKETLRDLAALALFLAALALWII